MVAIAPSVPLALPEHDVIEHMAHPRWVGRYEEWVDYHSDLMFAEPHSSKLREDMVAWALQTDAETLTVRLHADLDLVDEDEAREALANLTCPVLVIHGTEDNCQPVERGRAVAEVTGGRLVEIEGAGHVPHGRHPVLVNTLIKEFVDMHAPSTAASTSPAPTPWLFARERKRRALWVCSPIGLGHVLRDVAIARALRERVPDLEIEWLAQSPVTEVLATHGEIVHPASVELASESAHWESESTHHDLHAFYAFRRMDEILCANYMLFDDVVRETTYDLWVGDESWEVDHFLHENPERKIAPYAFLTDVVGFLPVDPEQDPREVELCADYNAEMVEHRERFPYVRDRSVFIGGYDELPDASLGAGLPTVRDYTRRWFTSVPYVVPFDPGAYRRPARLRRELGYGTGYPLYVAAVGGTAVGRDLLELTAEAFALVRKEEPDARMVMVTGPRLDPGVLPDVEGMEKRGYVDSLFEHLACADLSRGAGRAVDHDGAHRGAAAVRLLPARPPLGAAALRRAPAGPLRRRHPDGLRVHDAARAGRGDDGGALRPAHLSAGTPGWRRQGGGASGERAHRLTPGQLPHWSTWAPSVPIACEPAVRVHARGRREERDRRRGLGALQARELRLVVVRLLGAAVGDDPETGHRQDQRGGQHHQ